MYGLIGEGRPLDTELDFLVACIRHMRTLPSKQQQGFRTQMEEYFHLNPETASTFVYDDLVRLESMQAASLKSRDPKTLETIHRMVSGDYFRLDGRLALFREHFRLGHPKDGWFTFIYPTEYMERTMDYHQAWSLATEGRLTFGE